MNFLKADKNDNKIKLVYEFNLNSPLFARVAAAIVRNGNISEAETILENGIKQFADYPTGYLILSLCYAYAGKKQEAINAASKGAEIIDSPATLNFYLNKINDIELERSNLIDSVRNVFITQKEEQSPKISIEENLDELAKTLANAKINYKPDERDNNIEDVKEFTGTKIASETLANIYISQKNFKEAISTYKELIKKNPEKKEEYELKITEISQIIDTGLV